MSKTRDWIGPFTIGAVVGFVACMIFASRYTVVELDGCAVRVNDWTGSVTYLPRDPARALYSRH